MSNTIYVQCCRRHFVGIYIVQCKLDKITRVLPCLLTSAFGSSEVYTKINREK